MKTAMNAFPQNKTSTTTIHTWRKTHHDSINQAEWYLIQAKEKELLINEIPIEINPPTRKSRLFNSITEFVVKQMLIICKAFLLYKPLHFFQL